MFESLLYDEEGLLVLNLKQIQADYVSGQYKLNPYGKVYVSCPTGYYPLFAYLSRIAGMKDACEFSSSSCASSNIKRSPCCPRPPLRVRARNLILPPF